MNLSRTLPIAALGVLALAACGSDLKGTAALDAAAAPTTTQAAGASDACRDALDKADDLINLATDGLDTAADGFSVAADAFQAVSDFDVDALSDATEAVTGISQWFTDHKDDAQSVRAAYDSAKADCLG